MTEIDPASIDACDVPQADQAATLDAVLAI
jgi:hypothetical protein